MKNLKHVYDALPSSGQELALGLFGLNNRRRMAAWNHILAPLADSERWSREQQESYVSERLRLILAHAIQYVPRYAELARLLPDVARPGSPIFEILEQFPSITKSEVLGDPTRFLSTAFNPRRLKRTVTSGTTGTPFTTWIEPRALLVSDALWWRRTLWAGYAPGDWIARLVGDPVVPLSEQTPSRIFRVSRSDRRLYFSTYHLSRETAPAIARALLERRPAFLMGYPSALDALARLCNGVVNVDGWQPRAVLFSSEPLYEHQRDSIAEFIDAPIVGLYGCAERVVSAAQCSAGSYHLGLVDGFVEGEFGGTMPGGPTRITGLMNLAMPLIRYELGDAIAPLPDQLCPCGRTLPIIDGVVTKVEDSIVTPSGRVIGPSVVTWAFKDLRGLRKTQIIQRNTNVLEILVEADAADYADIRSEVGRRLDEMFFHELSLEFRREDAIDVTRAGKSRFVVSEMQ